MNRIIRFIAISGVLLGPLASPLLAPASARTTAHRDLAKEEASRQLVLSFYDRFFNAHETAQAATVIADDYVQHNPEVPDGKAPFLAYFTEFFRQNPQSRARIVRSAVDGDLVYLHVHSTNGTKDRGQAVVDIFRVRGGRIVEHWDVIQPVPQDAANDHTMF